MLATAHLVNHTIDPCVDLEQFLPPLAGYSLSSPALGGDGVTSTAAGDHHHHHPAGATLNTTHAYYIQMENSRDFGTWLHVAKCFKIWDLDARGYHRSMWRFFVNGHHLLVVGVPNSPYTRFKPAHLQPFAIDSTTGEPSNQI